MKKLLCFCFVFLFSSLRIFAADIKFIQIDNLRYSPNSQESVQKFKDKIKEINKEKGISFVIFTGNNIAKSDKKNLEDFLRKANRLHTPYYVALGHKDLNKKKGLSKAEYMKVVKNKTNKNLKSPNYTFSKKGMSFIVVDGAKEFIPTPFGYYRDEVISYVDEELTKNAKKNVVILQHFPLNPPDDREAFRTYKADDYLKMLDKHKNVKAVISGFSMNSEADVNGVKHITTADYPHYRIIEIVDCDSQNPTIWSELK